jgi:hypothetical protein
LTFADAVQSRDTLLAGVLSFPASLQFRAPDTESARTLGETLFRYTAAQCPPAPEAPGEPAQSGG